MTDRELLAISNFANMRLEFVNLVKELDDKTGKILGYYTIKEIFDEEYIALLNGYTDKDRKMFWGLTDEGDHMDEKAIYTGLPEFKQAAGIMYEYYEKFKLGNSEGAFVDQYEVL